MRLSYWPRLPLLPVAQLRRATTIAITLLLLRTLKEARTVAVESQPFDRATTNSLSELARALGKTEVSSPADLMFVLIRTQAEGIFYGPSGRELASFLVYARGPKGEERQLIWMETFDGEPDMAWPIVVYEIIRQFKASIR